MATYVPAKITTEYIFYIGLVSQSTGQFQSNPTIASGDFKSSRDGGALANLTTLPAVTPASSKMVKITLSASEMAGDNVTVIASDASGAEWDDVIINIQTAARQIDDLATTTNVSAVETDTQDIQSRLPAALSGDGFIKADMRSIDDELTSGNNATLNLKQLAIQNSAGDAVSIVSTGGNGDGIEITGNGTGEGVKISGGASSGNGLQITGGASNGSAVVLNGVGTGIGLVVNGGGTNTVGLEVSGSAAAVNIYSNDADSTAVFISGQGTGHGIDVQTAGSGKSINAPQDIAVSDGDLTLANIATETADQVWEETLADHSGTTGSTAEQLAAAGAAGDPWATAIPGAYGAGTAGKIIGDNINATISSRATQTSVDDIPTNAELTTALGTADDATLAAIAALNDLSQADVRDAVGLASANLDTQLDAIPTAAENASQVRTELTTELGNIDAAISSRSSHSAADVWSVGTRTLTSFGTLVADIWSNATRTLTAISDSAGITTLLARLTSTRADNLDNLDATVSSRLADADYTAPDNTSITAIKAKTDQLAFGVTNAVNANITHVIADPVQENGADDTNWGGTP